MVLFKLLIAVSCVPMDLFDVSLVSFRYFGGFGGSSSLVNWRDFVSVFCHISLLTIS